MAHYLWRVWQEAQYLFYNCLFPVVLSCLLISHSRARLACAFLRRARWLRENGDLFDSSCFPSAVLSVRPCVARFVRDRSNSSTAPKEYSFGGAKLHGSGTCGRILGLLVRFEAKQCVLRQPAAPETMHRGHLRGAQRLFVSCALVSLSLSVTGKKRRKTKRG